MPETASALSPSAPETGCSFCLPGSVRPATVVVEYRVPDPRSATRRADDRHDGPETFDPVHLLVCPDPRCIDLAEDQAVYDGAPEHLIDSYLLTAALAVALLGPVEMTQVA